MYVPPPVPAIVTPMSQALVPLPIVVGIFALIIIAFGYAILKK